MAEYCLRWNNHQPNLVTVFSELLTAESLVDVTLATDGHFIHAHKLVLSACSVYFKDLFGSNPCKHPIVFLKDIRIEDLKTVIDFIYRGEVNVAQERLQDVLKTAESLRIKGLADKPFSQDEYSSQNRGQILTSSFSSQRSSLTDSRDQQASVENEDAAGDNSSQSPPQSKKRKIAGSEDSTESVQGSNHDEDHSGKEEVSVQRKTSSSLSESEENLKASTTPLNSLKEKIKEEQQIESSADPRPEYQESRAADAMLLLQGSSSEGGAEDGASTPSTSTTITRTDSTAHLGSQTQGRLGRPPGTFKHKRLLGASVHTMNDGKMKFDSFYRPSCLNLRPKLKATNGSYVTIRTGTVDNFMKAIQEVRGGKMGFCKAGKIYGVNPVTLQKFYKAMGYSIKNKSNNPNFVKSAISKGNYDDTQGNNTVASFSSPSQYQDYSDRSIYTHFMTPSSLDFFSRGECSKPLSYSNSNRSSHSNAILDSFNVGRLLNYSSLPYDLSDDSIKHNTDQSASFPPTTSLAPTLTHSNPSSSSTQGPTSHTVENSSSATDVSSVVLCNL